MLRENGTEKEPDKDLMPKSAFRGITPLACAWEVGTNCRGTGSQNGQVVTVDWGDAHPVIYVVRPDGALHGTMADRLPLERLKPPRAYQGGSK